MTELDKTAKKVFAIVYLIGAGYSSLFLLMDGLSFFETSHAYIWKKPLLIISLLAMIIGAIVVFFWSGFFAEEERVDIAEEPIEDMKNKSLEAVIEQLPRYNEYEIDTFVDSFETDRYFDATANEQLLSAFCKEIDACQSVVYLRDNVDQLVLEASFALSGKAVNTIEAGEGLAGQVVQSKRPLILTELPPGFLKVVSGLGEDYPSQLIILPVLDDEKVIAVVELASFVSYTEVEQKIIINGVNSLVKRMMKELAH